MAFDQFQLVKRELERTARSEDGQLLDDLADRPALPVDDGGWNLAKLYLAVAGMRQRLLKHAA